MNCANHPETPAVAYCQYCGKPLCAQCIHKVNNIISCEPCLAARVHAASGYGGTGAGPATPHAGPLQPGDLQRQPWGTEPWVAFVLGFIPGVGAMYNGQFAKGIAHVIIFVLLVDFTKYNGLLGLLIAAWVIYQVFDAYQTAIARREGLPLPNPLGLNNVNQWFGARGHGPYSGANPNATSAGNAATPPEPMGAAPASAFASEYVPPPYAAPPVPPMPPDLYGGHNLWRNHGGGLPTGAIILIVLGVLFLLGNFGILSENWLDHGWPILLIALGVWMVIRHNYNPPAGGVR